MGEEISEAGLLRSGTPTKEREREREGMRI
jgi:hypothetical protein